MSKKSSDTPHENYNPYYIPTSGQSTIREPNGYKRTQKQIENESGGVVKTEHGERYRCLVIDRSGSSEIPNSL